jgi:hypothetical protein
MVGLFAAPGGANDGLPDLPTPPGASSATLVNYQIVNPNGGDVICSAYFAKRGDGVVHVWQYCTEGGGFVWSVAATSHIVGEPSDLAQSNCKTHRKGFQDSGIQELNLAVDVIELDGDEGDLRDFLPEVFTHEVCEYEWTWTEETVQPLVRIW